jgi:hypothetical protein
MIEKTEMTALRNKIKLALDESRMVVLGTQIFLGFQYRAAFEKKFETLPRSSQLLAIAALVLALGTIALLISPGAYHRIVRDGSDAPDVHSFTTRVMDWALILLIAALGIDVFIVSHTMLGTVAAATHGSLTSLTAIGFWYVFGFVAGGFGKKRPAHEESPRAAPTSLNDKIDHALTEARVVLPGVQALLGFQLLTTLMEGFDKLPPGSKYIHITSMTLLALAMILLMTPAAYHRIAEGGENTKRFHGIASAFLLAAMIVLPIGICGDAFVIVRKITDSATVAVAISMGILVFFYLCWFGYPIYRRRRIHGE